MIDARSRPHVAAAVQAARRSRRPEPRPAARTRAQLISDGVVAGYIHNLSRRHVPRRTQRGEDG